MQNVSKSCQNLPQTCQNVFQCGQNVSNFNNIKNMRPNLGEMYLVWSKRNQIVVKKYPMFSKCIQMWSKCIQSSTKTFHLLKCVLYKIVCWPVVNRQLIQSLGPFQNSHALKRLQLLTMIARAPPRLLASMSWKRPTTAQWRPYLATLRLYVFSNHDQVHFLTGDLYPCLFRFNIVTLLRPHWG